MSKKRFEITEYGSNYYIEIIDNEKELDESIDNPSQRLLLVECVDLLNELSEENEKLRFLIDINSVSERTKLERQVDKQQATIEKQNELIKLIANACTYSKEHSVKEILRKEIKGIDTVTYESANAWHDYVILSEFFKEHYKEHWDNE